MKTSSPVAWLGLVVDDDRRRRRARSPGRCAPARRRAGCPAGRPRPCPTTDEMTVNTTSRPSTNASAAASTQTAAGAPNGKRRRKSSGTTKSASRRHREPPRRGRLAGVVPQRDLERDRRSPRARSARRIRTCARGEPGRLTRERTPRARAPPPTQVGARNRRPVGGANTAFRRRRGGPASVASMAEVHTRQGGEKCPQRPPERTSRPGWVAGVPTTGRRRRSAG